MATIVRELRETVLNSRVSNVYQLDAKTLLLKLRKQDRPVSRLLIGAGQRLHLTSYVTEKPKVPPAFCMALRKYLRNGWLVNVEQHEFERVVVFSFKTKTGTVKLVLELFGVGNIILVDEKGEILHALSYKRMRDRNILRGEVFRFAPSISEDPLKVDKEELFERLRKFDDIEVVRALARLLGVGGVYAEEVLLRVKIDKKKPCEVLSESEVYGIFEELQRMLSQVLDGKLEPCVVSDKAGDFVDVVPIRLERYQGFKHEAYENMLHRLSEEASEVPVEDTGLIALDWLNGRRNPDADYTLKGAIAGLNLGTTAPKIYRSLVEATAFGAKSIAERLIGYGIEVEEVIALGGIPQKSAFVMQVISDVFNMPIKISKSEQATALGSAMFGAVVAGAFTSVQEAQEKMGSGFSKTYLPDPSNVAKYENLYEKYLHLGQSLEDQLRAL